MGYAPPARVERQEVAVPYFVVWRTHRAGHRPGVPTRAIGGAPDGYATRRAAEAAAHGSAPHAQASLWDEWAVIYAETAVSALHEAGTVSAGWLRR
jgi:hypothetical protein